MACRHPGHHRPWQRDLALHHLAGGHHRQHAGGGNAQCVHGLAHEVLAQHGTECGPAVATTGEAGAARTLEVQVVASAVGVGDLTKQHGPAVAQTGGETTELVAGVALSHRVGAGRNHVAHQHSDAVR